MADKEELKLEQENVFNLEKELESQPFITHIDFDPDISDFKAVYRKGNFGLKRGRIDLIVARRWSVAHLVVVLIMFSLNLTMAVLMGRNHNYWMDEGLANSFTTCCVLSGIGGTLTTCCSLYLVRHLASLRRPLFLLLFVRLLAVLECFLVVSALVTTFFVVANVKDISPERQWETTVQPTAYYRWRRWVVYNEPIKKAKTNENYGKEWYMSTDSYKKDEIIGYVTSVPIATGSYSLQLTEYDSVKKDGYYRGNMKPVTPVPTAGSSSYIGTSNIKTKLPWSWRYVPTNSYPGKYMGKVPTSPSYYKENVKGSWYMTSSYPEKGSDYYRTTANWRRWKLKEYAKNKPTIRELRVRDTTVSPDYMAGDYQRNKVEDDDPPTKNYQRNKHADQVNSGTFRVVCVFFVITLIADLIATVVWLFHWWRCWGCFECFKSLAIFQPGEPLVNGVSDPRNGIISECAYLCWATYNGADCGTII